MSVGRASAVLAVGAHARYKRRLAPGGGAGKIEPSCMGLMVANIHVGKGFGVVVKVPLDPFEEGLEEVCC